MAKFCFPSCCCSCSCFSSSSPPQQETPSSSTQPPQQQATSSPLRSPQQQTIAGHSTSSPSQPSQQEAIAASSAATSTDLKSFLQKFNGISQLHCLIQFIEELLKIASGEKSEEGSTSAVASYIQDGQTFLGFVDKHVGKLPEKKDSIDGSAEIQKVVTDLLKGARNIHWVGAAFSVVGFVLARFDQMSNNQRECLQILKAMVDLGKQILRLNEQMPDQKQKLNEAVECIVEGCFMSASQLTTAKTFRFLTASVNADGLKAFQAKIDRLYDDLTLLIAIETAERVPKNAPQPQELFENESAVGIDSARDEVIQLLEEEIQNTSSQVVVVHGFGGIGKTTLADAVYAHIDLTTYQRCRIHMDQNCTKNDLKALQEQILNGLFSQNVKLTDCDHGRGMIRLYFKKNPNRPLFLYIDNGLRSADLEELLPKDLGSCLPPKSRILVTTRNLHETDTFVGRNIQRRQYAVSPLPEEEAREILLKKVSDYNDENNIHYLLQLCGGVPLLLELAGSQLAINTSNKNNIVLDMLREGEKVEEKDISDRMVDFVYKRLSPRVKEAFLDITSFFCGRKSEDVAYIVGEEEFRALAEASFVKTTEGSCGPKVTVHDIVQARGKKMSEQNRITDRESFLECLKDEEKLKNLKGIYFIHKWEQPTIQINDDHLKCMSNSLRVLYYIDGSQITFTFKEKCHKPFKQLRCLDIASDIPELPMEFDEKLEHLVYYRGARTQGMSLYELPPTLRIMKIIGSFENGVAYSKIPPKVTTPSSLVKLEFFYISTMERLPDGVEKLTKLEVLDLSHSYGLKVLSSDIDQLKNLEVLNLYGCSGLEEWPLNFGDLPKLKNLDLTNCSSKLKESLPNNIRENCNINFFNNSPLNC